MNKEVKGIAITIGLVFVGLVALVIFSPKTDNTLNPENFDEKLYSESAYNTGNTDAIVQIVEFGDYQCPGCAAVHSYTEELLSNYTADQVNLSFRHFPLSGHANAIISAEAAESAGAQGKFWEMHDLLYVNQNEWANERNPLEIYKKYAQNLELDVERFVSDIENDVYREKISSDLADGLAINVRWTPSIYVDGELLTELPSLEEFKSIIDTKLAENTIEANTVEIQTEDNVKIEGQIEINPESI